MIFVLLGTQDSPFPRILQQTEEAIHRLKFHDQVYAQVGTTPYQSTLMKVQDYFIGAEYERLFHEARIIICHGGAGVMFKAINLRKKVIALPRLKKYGEHNDDHQVELVHKLASLGLIYEATAGITKAIIAMNSFEPKLFQRGGNIIDAVRDFIEQL